jgi:hypothetical protein
MVSLKGVLRHTATLDLLFLACPTFVQIKDAIYYRGYSVLKYQIIELKFEIKQCCGLSVRYHLIQTFSLVQFID